MAKTIAFAHHKGGTGKTTSCINIAGFMAKADKKVLVVDLDPQGNATSGLGIDKSALDKSMYHVMDKQLSIITKMRANGISGLLISLENETNREVRAEIAQLCDKVIKV